jgi:MFS family permease
MAGRMSDTVGTKRAIVLGLSGIVVSGVLTFSPPCCRACPLLSLLILIVGGCCWASPRA